MKLFNPAHAEHFVFAVCPKGYREGTSPNYAPVKAVDVETAERQLYAEKLVNVYSHPVGRYDEKNSAVTTLTSRLSRAFVPASSSCILSLIRNTSLIALTDGN